MAGCPTVLATGLLVCMSWQVASNAHRQAQFWPDRPVKIVLPFTAGGGTDQTPRVRADKLSEAFGRQFIVENRGGGASRRIGVEGVTTAPKDGYTFRYTPNASISVVPSLRKVGFDPAKDFNPVGRTGDASVASMSHPSLASRRFRR